MEVCTSWTVANVRQDTLCAAVAGRHKDEHALLARVRAVILLDNHRRSGSTKESLELTPGSQRFPFLGGNFTADDPLNFPDHHSQLRNGKF
jgi:hypothetical protein